MPLVRLTFRQKLLISFFLFSILPLAICGFLVSQSTREIYQSSTETAFLQTTTVREELLRRYLESLTGLMRSIAAQELLLSEVNAAVSGRSFNQNQVFVTLVSLRRENPFVEKVFIVNRAGVVIASTASDEEGQSFAANSQIDAALKSRQPLVGAVALSTYGKRVIPITAPLIRQNDNATIGALVLEVNVAALSATFAPKDEVAGLRNAAIYAVDGDGYVVARSDGLSFRDQIWTYPARKCQRENESVSGEWQGATEDTVFGVSRCITIDDLRLTLIAEEPTATAFLVSRQAGMRVLLVAAAATAFLSIAFFWVAHSVTRPIELLRLSARQLGNGNFNTPITVTTTDELADLAADFDRTRLKIKALREQEANLAEMKSEFISIAAHQLRTPLTGIKWSVEDLMNHTEWLPAEKITDLKRTVRSVNEMIALVNDLLNVNRLEDGRMEYVLVPGDLSAFVREVAEAVHARHPEKRIEFTVYPPEPALPSISFDREKFSIVITNIVDNAIKYTPDGGAVTIRFIAGPGSVVIEVADTGIGIPKAELQNLFAKFFRAKNAIHTEVSGSGLGLFVAREIMKAHGGSISVDSREGRGTRMHIRMPLSSPGISSVPYDGS